MSSAELQTLVSHVWRQAFAWAFEQVAAWVVPLQDWASPWLNPLAETAIQFGRWLEPWTHHRLAVVMGVIILLLVVMVLMVLYTVWLRLRLSRRALRLKSLNTLWNHLVPAYMAEMETLVAVKKAVPRQELRIFGNYLRPLLMDIEGEDRDRLLVLLQALGYPKHLQAMSRQRSEWTRAFAVNFLGLMGLPEALPLIRQRLSDHSELVRYTAAEALMQMKDVEYLPRVLEWMARDLVDRQDGAATLLFEFEAEILGPLLAILRDSEIVLPDWLKALACTIFAHNVYPEATWDIVQMVNASDNRELRIAGVRALVQLEDPVLVDFFESLLNDPDPVLVSVAAQGLGTVGNKDHVPLLARLLSREDFWLVRAVVMALSNLGAEGNQALINATRSVGEPDTSSALTVRLVREMGIDSASAPIPPRETP